MKERKPGSGVCVDCLVCLIGCRLEHHFACGRAFLGGRRGTRSGRGDGRNDGQQRSRSGSAGLGLWESAAIYSRKLDIGPAGSGYPVELD